MIFVRYPGRTWAQALCSAASVNSPAPQSEHESLPRLEYLPATQMSQAVWSALVLVPGSLRLSRHSRRHSRRCCRRRGLRIWTQDQQSFVYTRHSLEPEPMVTPRLTPRAVVGMDPPSTMLAPNHVLAPVVGWSGFMHDQQVCCLNTLMDV